MTSVAFHTLGCRLNQAETAALSGGLEALGFAVSYDAAKADVVIIHSCAITHAAETECLRLIRHAKRRAPPPVVVFTGCATATADAAALAEAGADIIIPQHDKRRLPEILAAELLGNECTAAAAHALPVFGTTRAPVKIQDGCDFRCTYCIVPDARGKPMSRGFNEIIDEAAGIVSRGYREIVLTGVNIGCYKSNGRGLADLSEALITQIPDCRIRLGSLEPGTAEREIVDLMISTPRICRFLHLPLQSGDAGILRAMKRRYNPAQYTAAVNYAVEKIPEIAIGADIITGFPGETEEAFKSTVDMVTALPFSNLHVFPYSERPGTPAASMPGKIPVEIRRKRAKDLMSAGDAKRTEYMERFRGRTVDVLVESVDAEGNGRGWTGEYLEASVPGLTPADCGKILSVPFIPAS